MSDQTGVILDLAQWRSMQDRQGELKRQSEVVADALIRNGVDPFRKDTGFSVVSLVTMRVEQADTQYRNINLIPSVAAANRYNYLLELELFLREWEYGRFVRYGVITTGTRCEAVDIKSRKKKTNDQMNEWSRHCLSRYGIEIVLKTFETPWENGKGFHPHFNVLYAPKRKLTKDEWSAFLVETAAHFGTNWKDNGKLENVRELIKYVMKPESVIELAESDPLAFVRLHEALFRSRIIIPQGRFAAWRKQLDEQRLKVVRENITVHGKQMVRLATEEKAEVARSENPDRWQDEGSNVVCAYQKPNARFTPVLEPTILVKNLDLQTIFNNPRVFFEREKALRYWRERTGGLSPQAALDLAVEARRASYKVHKNTITSEGKQNGYRRKRRPPSDQSDVGGFDGSACSVLEGLQTPGDEGGLGGQWDDAACLGGYVVVGEDDFELGGW